MSGLIGKRFRKAGSIACISFMLFAPAIPFGPDQHAWAEATFQKTGNTARDVMQALIQLDQLQGPLGDPTSSPVRQAITDAERNYGLPADGIADESLLDHLVAELANSDGEEGGGFGFTLKDVSILAGIISTAGMLLLAYLKYLRPSATTN